MCLHQKDAAYVLHLTVMQTYYMTLLWGDWRLGSCTS